MKDPGYEHVECEECGRNIPILDRRRAVLCYDCEERQDDEEREREQRS